MTKQGKDDAKDVEKPNAGEAKLGAERPPGAPQEHEGHQPVDIKGESLHTPELQPGRDPNNKAKNTGN